VEVMVALFVHSIVYENKSASQAPDIPDLPLYHMPCKKRMVFSYVFLHVSNSVKRFVVFLLI
jgi:hypothetical protein